MYPLAAIVLMPTETQRRARIAAKAALMAVPTLFNTPTFWAWWNEK